jgi:uncharacterized membrane protein YedE/YeeE
MMLFKSTGLAVAVTFGLAVAGSFWWEVAEPIRNSNWSGSGEQWLALGSLIFGGCATFVAGGAALFALTKRETTESSRDLPKPLTFFHLTGPRTG